MAAGKMQAVGAMHAGLAEIAGEGSPPGSQTFKVILSTLKAFVGPINRESVKLQLGKLRVLGRTFFNPRAFSKPADRTEWLSRVRLNASHYWNVYSVLFGGVVVYTVLSSPWFLLGMAMMAGAWAYAFVVTGPDMPLTVMGFELRRKEKFLVLGPFSLLVVALCGMINSIIYAVFLAGFISLPHASFHEPAELDALDALELDGLQDGAV